MSGSFQLLRISFNLLILYKLFQTFAPTGFPTKNLNLSNLSPQQNKNSTVISIVRFDFTSDCPDPKHAETNISYIFINSVNQFRLCFTPTKTITRPLNLRSASCYVIPHCNIEIYGSIATRSADFCGELKLGRKRTDGRRFRLA